MSQWLTPVVLATLLTLTCRSAVADLSALVVGGLGGTPEYAEQFERQADTIGEALQSVAARPSSVRILASGAERDRVLAALDELADEAADRVVIVLLGHASVDARQWRFNLPGPDLTTADLVAGLAGLSSPEQLVVLSTSASGALLDVLAEPGRLLVTATKSAGEINAVRFGESLAEAMGSSKADIDRNEILTVAEAFLHADEQTRDYYETRNLLASEHARLRGEGADAFSLARLGSLKAAGDDPAVAALLSRRLDLERAFRRLKLDKADIERDTYYRRLERLLIRIATLQETIDAETGWTDTDSSASSRPARPVGVDN